MKLKDGFMLRNIAENWIVVPLGQRVVDFNGLISLSESSALLWKKLEAGASEDELVQEILSVYDIDENTARNDVMHFIKELDAKELIEK